jgi:uncharacterized protein (TIRG00374 family)
VGSFGRDVFDGAPADAAHAPPELAKDRSFREVLAAHRRPLLASLTISVIVVAGLVLAPQAAGISDTLHRIRRGDKVWLLAGAGFEALSILSYVAVFRETFSCGGVTIGWRTSTQITLAGIVATKLLAAAGAGGIALTAWALRASGLEGRVVARRMTAFEILLYAVYMLALVVFGVGLGTHVLPGRAPTALTLVPAAFGAGVIALVVAMRFSADPIARWLASRPRGSGRLSSMPARLAALPSTFREGVIAATELVRHPRWGLLGALGYWAFDVATLWAAFQAFGVQLPIAVLVLGYFIGTLGNVLPIPGGVGGVEGGMIAAFLGFGVDGGTAILAVLSYRLISYWLPVVPGGLAYVQLRRTVARWRGAEGPAQLPARAG